MWTRSMSWRQIKNISIYTRTTNITRYISCMRIRHSSSLVSPILPLTSFTINTNFISRRGSSGVLQTSEISVKLTELMDAFAEARELIMEAKESIGTVYASEDIHDAREQTEKTLTLWKELQEMLSKMGNTVELDKLQKEHGMKMTQLSAELEDAEHAIGDD